MRNFILFIAMVCLFGSCKKEIKNVESQSRLLHAERGANPGIYDKEGRYILLRGANYNVLGDYWQGNPLLPTTKSYDINDFKMMAAQGFNCVRLIFNWSAIEPTKGNYDRAYIDRIRKVTDDATSQGLYVLLDMHQDAWSKFTFSLPSDNCEFPNKGWDGAPEWATIYDDASRCTLNGGRETTPAVYHSFQSLWDNREGIQDALIASWVEVVKATADNEMVLGYDIFNEPSLGYKNVNEELYKLGKFYKRTIEAIRNAEKSNNLPEHIAFFEMGISWNGEPIPSFVFPEFTNEQNLVFAPHNYFESITYLLTIEQGYEATNIFNNNYKTHMFMGEWGFFDSNPENDKSKMKRFAKMEDKYLYGSTIWQWSQTPGDPHAINFDGTTPQQTSLHLIELDQAGQFTGNINTVFLNVLSRNRPLAIVGKPRFFETDSDNGKMKLKASSGKAGITKLWINKRYGTPIIDGENSTLDKLESVEGGFIGHVKVDGDYEINVNY